MVWQEAVQLPDIYNMGSRFAGRRPVQHYLYLLFTVVAFHAAARHKNQLAGRIFSFFCLPDEKNHLAGVCLDLLCLIAIQIRWTSLA
ncbi:hypothetical protein G3601_003851 [Salmonella enterica]|nr:hypothetical protein [Salmonella enterica]